MKDAAYFYKRGQCYKDAFRCFEQIQEFDLALKMCCYEDLYEEAAKCVERCVFEESVLNSLCKFVNYYWVEMYVALI